MNILLHGKCFNACKSSNSISSALSVSICAFVWLRIPSTESFNYSTFLSLFTGELYRSKILRRGVSREHENGPQNSVLRLGDYDCIGFDLDNTLCEYNLSSSVSMEYNVLSNFLVKERGYDPYLLKPLDAHSIGFLQKGLIIDFSRGNVLKLGENGVILKASHGTKQMTGDEIVITYGKDKQWQVTREFSANVVAAWDGPLSEKMRALLDYFDMPASLAFARIVDSLDNKLGKPADMYNVWVDVRDGLVNMYRREHFESGKGDYFKEIKSNPHKFIKRCDVQVVEWLAKLKESKITYLITGSNCDFASMTAESCLGKNWRSLFDLVICYARKPGFFTGCRPFVQLDNFKETHVINGDDLQLGHIYSQGNWQELYQLFGRHLDKKEPKCLYFGDNLIQDIYTPSEYTKCDTVAVVEELKIMEERKETLGHPNFDKSKEILESLFWGSYFFDDTEKVNTMWGSIIKRHAKVCIPSLSALAKYSSLNDELPTISSGRRLGYFPISPISNTGT